MARPAGADEIVALHREARHEEALAAIMEPLTGKDSRAADQTDQAVRLLNELALASMQRGAACFSFEAAFAYLRRAQKLLNVSPALKAVTLNNLSIYHSRTHQPHAAERCLQRALELIGGVARPHGAHADGDDISVHICLNLTTVLADIGRHRDSLSMAQQAVKALGRQKKPSAGSTLPDPTVQLASAAYYNLAVQQGAMQQLLLWIGLLETLSGIPAIIQTLKGSERMPGDFGFDPLGCGKDPNALARRQLVELKNGRLAMIAVGGMVHHYLLVGRGPIEFIKNIPNFKNPLPPF